jgi:hypothetical protein
LLKIIIIISLSPSLSLFFILFDGRNAESFSKLFCLLDSLDYTFVSFVHGLLCPNASSRMTPQQALCHPYLAPFFPFCAIFRDLQRHRPEGILPKDFVSGPRKRGRLRGWRKEEDESDGNGNLDVEVVVGTPSSSTSSPHQDKNGNEEDDHSPETAMLKQEGDDIERNVDESRAKLQLILRSVTKELDDDGSEESEKISEFIDRKPLDPPICSPMTRSEMRRLVEQALLLCKDDSDDGDDGDSLCIDERESKRMKKTGRSPVRSPKKRRKEDVLYGESPVSDGKKSTVKPKHDGSNEIPLKQEKGSLEEDSFVVEQAAIVSHEMSGDGLVMLDDVDDGDDDSAMIQATTVHLVHHAQDQTKLPASQSSSSSADDWEEGDVVLLL